MKINRFTFSSVVKIIVIFIMALLLTFTLSDSIEGKEDQLPPLRVYPLPETLANWQHTNQEDYFSQIKSHPVGYLIWTEFPIKVYLESPSDNLSPSALQQFQQWQKAAQKAIDFWNPYLSMIIVEQESQADIFIYRRPPQLKAKLNPQTGLYDLPRIRAATTSVKFHFDESSPPRLKHTMTIEVNPRQTYDYLVSNISHELGHALGIWGHSENSQDVMYYSHSQNIPALSVRDINTLKKIYQQSTRLGSAESFSETHN